jgi:hypothetical protein
MVCEQAYDTAAAGSLQQVVVAQALPLLLPHATNGQLGYAAAMLNPFHDSQKLLANPSMRFIELEAAAAACSDVECRLQQQRAADATRVLRELVAALGSRSLELAAAFAAAAQQQLAIADLVGVVWCGVVWFGVVCASRGAGGAVHSCKAATMVLVCLCRW